MVCSFVEKRDTTRANYNIETLLCVLRLRSHFLMIPGFARMFTYGFGVWVAGVLRKNDTGVWLYHWSDIAKGQCLYISIKTEV